MKKFNPLAPKVPAMKKLILTFIICSGIVSLKCMAQVDTVKVLYKTILANQIKITDRNLQYNSIKNNETVTVSKSDVQFISFHNGLKLTFEKTKAIDIQSIIYNATINLYSGSLFTAFVDSIDSINVYYHKYNEQDPKIISVRDIQYITYLNGLKENFNIIATTKKDAQKKSPEKAVSKKEEKKKLPEKAIETRKDRVSYIGVTAGLSNAWLSFDEGYLNRKGRNGILAGINYEHKFTNSSGINLGLRYEEKGSIFNNDSIKSAFNYNYLTIPFNYRVYFGEQKLHLYFEGGFYLAALLSAHYQYENTANGQSENVNLYKLDIKVHPVDFGPVIGMGLSLKNNFNNISIGMNYNLGLVPVISNQFSYANNYYDYAAVNRNVTVYIIYGFDLKGWKLQQLKTKQIK